MILNEIEFKDISASGLEAELLEKSIDIGDSTHKIKDLLKLSILLPELGERIQMDLKELLVKFNLKEHPRYPNIYNIEIRRLNDREKAFLSIVNTKIVCFAFYERQPALYVFYLHAVANTND